MSKPGSSFDSNLCEVSACLRETEVISALSERYGARRARAPHAHRARSRLGRMDHSSNELCGVVPRHCEEHGDEDLGLEGCYWRLKG